MCKLILLLITGLFLIACEPKSPSTGNSDQADQGSPAGGAATAGEPREGVFDPMLATMDKAKGVDDLGSARKDAMDKAIEESADSADWE